MSTNNSYYVIGVQRSKGEYNGHQYDNAVFYVGRDCPTKDGMGFGYLMTDRVKVRYNPDVDYQVFLNEECQVSYDRYGKPCGIMFTNLDEYEL